MDPRRGLLRPEVDFQGAKRHLHPIMIQPKITVAVWRDEPNLFADLKRT